MMSMLYFPDGTKVQFEEVDVANPQRSIDTLTMRMAMYSVKYGGMQYRVAGTRFQVLNDKQTVILFEMEEKK